MMHIKFKILINYHIHSSNSFNPLRWMKFRALSLAPSRDILFHLNKIKIKKYYTYSNIFLIKMHIIFKIFKITLNLSGILSILLDV